MWMSFSLFFLKGHGMSVFGVWAILGLYSIRDDWKACGLFKRIRREGTGQVVLKAPGLFCTGVMSTYV